MEVKVSSRSGRELGVFFISDETTVRDFKKLFNTKFSKWSPDRQWFTVGTARGTPLKEEAKTLAEYLQGTKELVFKDLGMQMSWRLVYVIEYAGPILIQTLLYFTPGFFYGKESPRTFTQNVGFLMLVGHFIKRELESIFVHRFSSATMPITRLPINCGHYWLLNGLLIGWFFFHPLYTEPDFSPVVKLGLVGAFTVFEVLNGITHLILRDLRKPGSKERGIPKGFGFDQVSCANYFWEICAWTSFAVLSNTATSYVFLAASVATLIKWARERHYRYKAEFDGKDGRPLYPKERKALIPFIL
jgi:very-long-chain enoyl-CoA reductase